MAIVKLRNWRHTKIDLELEKAGEKDPKGQMTIIEAVDAFLIFILASTMDLLKIPTNAM